MIEIYLLSWATSFKRTWCAQDRTRTYTAAKPLVPETSVYTNFTTWASRVVPLGFEPRLTEPKPAVLPLHNGTIHFRRCKYSMFFVFLQKKQRKFKQNNYFHIVSLKMQKIITDYESITQTPLFIIIFSNKNKLISLSKLT